MRSQAPVKTGNLRNRIFYRRSGLEGGLEIIGAAPYTQYVVKGTPAHLIRPRSGRVLAFQGGGATVFAARVNHPGTAANRFHERGWRIVAERVHHLLAAHTRRSLILEGAELVI
jgi:hypothetical protein